MEDDAEDVFGESIETAGCRACDDEIGLSVGALGEGEVFVSGLRLHGFEREVWLVVELDICCGEGEVMALIWRKPSSEFLV